MLLAEPLQKALNIIISIADPDKVILFGSRARGDATTDSDYDLLVLKKGVKNNRKLSQKLYLKSDFDIPIDIIVHDTKKFDILKESPYMIYRSISLEGITIYEKS
jgi:uncharacterized protein